QSGGEARSACAEPALCWFRGAGEVSSAQGAARQRSAFGYRIRDQATAAQRRSDAGQVNPGEIRTYGQAVAVVTGGASGIGAALSRALARRGSVVVVSDRQLDGARETSRGIEQSGGQAEAVEADVRDAQRIASMIEHVWEP